MPGLSFLTGSGVSWSRGANKFEIFGEMFRWVACFLGESHDSGRRMGWSRVVERVGYTEENSARTGSGGRIRDLGLFQAISWDDWSYREPFVSREFFYF